MSEKINIAELLKGCPSGMELDCSTYDNVTLVEVQEDSTYPIKIETPDGRIVLTKYGGVSYNKLSKCIIYPKGKTTWEGFQRPFEDGDVVATTEGLWIGITTGGEKGKFIPTYCVIQCDGKFKAYLDRKESWVFNRFATEEEKKKLFDAIKEHGYYWNPETKTLEKLVVKPKFKIGDYVVHHKYGKGDITQIIWIADEIVYEVYFCDTHFESFTTYCKPNELCVPTKFDITTLVPFESKVLVRHNKDNKWCGSFFSHIDGDFHSHCYKFVTIAGKSYPMCIPYEGNEHLLGTTNECDEYFKNW